MKIDIDKNSGFCFGVVNAIKKAEEELGNGTLFSVGDIVHNDREVTRLKNKGLSTVSYDDFSEMKGKRVLFRAHGEPPESYLIAKQNGLKVIDASCPVVLNLQKQIFRAYNKLKETGGSVVIYGKHGHAEVIGLVGQTEGNAIVVSNMDDLSLIDYTKPIELFSQTTMGLDNFHSISEAINSRVLSGLTIHDTICRKVANRIPQLINFANEYDCILFVSDNKSSNGKQLYNVCLGENKNTWFIQDLDDIKLSMIQGHNSVGITGATSTPLWMMENVAEHIKKMIE